MVGSGVVSKTAIIAFVMEAGLPPASWVVRDF
jgi:hypothetical protein